VTCFSVLVSVLVSVSVEWEKLMGLKASPSKLIIRRIGSLFTAE
jgi:hypothetical protein